MGVSRTSRSSLRESSKIPRHLENSKATERHERGKSQDYWSLDDDSREGNDEKIQDETKSCKLKHQMRYALGVRLEPDERIKNSDTPEHDGQSKSSSYLKGIQWR
ncbi:hypothetical protein Tco_1538108 [Tanacetum coccineum]